MSSSATIDAQVSSIEAGLRGFIERNDRKTAEHDQKHKVHDARLMAIEQQITPQHGATGLGGFGSDKNIGDIVINSQQLEMFEKGARSSGQIQIGSFKTITTGPWSAAPDFRPQIAGVPTPALPLRALIPSFPTVSNLVEFGQESTATDAADYQAVEGTAKPQSDLSFSLVQRPVATIATWIAASRQLIDDSPALGNFVNTRVMYFVEQKVEHELLFGDRGSGHLLGIATQATPAAGGTFPDLIAEVAAAASQLSVLGIVPDGCVCSSQDFWDAGQLKASGSGVYAFGDPMNPAPPSIWGLPLVLSSQIPKGKYLVGSFRTQSAIRFSVNDPHHVPFGYAAGLISAEALFLPITFNASGIVVSPPTSARARPAAFR